MEVLFDWGVCLRSQFMCTTIRYVCKDVACCPPVDLNGLQKGREMTLKLEDDCVTILKNEYGHGLFN